MGLIGQNGAGKSTTINSILNLVNFDSGDIKIFGKETSSINKDLRNDIGVVFDEINFHETFTVKNINNVTSRIYSRWDKNLFFNYMKNFNLPLNKQIKNFSKGMKMKLSISIALSHYPKLLILDESTSGLDPVVRDEILDIFLDFVQDENHSILISSHITSDLEKIADYISFIHDGEIIFTKNKDELIYNYGVIKCSEKQFNDLNKNDILVFRKKDYNYEALTSNKIGVAKKYKNLIIDTPTIDEIMLLYVKGEKLC